MALFYDRIETENEIKIVLKYQAAFYILLLGCFVFVYAAPYTGMSESTGMIILLSVLALMIIYAVSKIGIGREIKKAMKFGSVQISGSKFSFSHPLTFTIKK